MRSSGAIGLGACVAPASMARFVQLSGGQCDVTFVGWSSGHTGGQFRVSYIVFVDIVIPYELFLWRVALRLSLAQYSFA